MGSSTCICVDVIVKEGTGWLKFNALESRTTTEGQGSACNGGLVQHFSHFSSVLEMNQPCQDPLTSVKLKTALLTCYDGVI